MERRGKGEGKRGRRGEGFSLPLLLDLDVTVG